MRLEHPRNPLRLAGQIAIVGAAVGTELHQRPAIQGIGSDRRDHRAGGGTKLAQRSLVGSIGQQQRHRLAGPEFVTQAFQLVPRPPRHRPAQFASRRKALDQIAAQDLTDEAGGAIDDQVQRFWGHLELLRQIGKALSLGQPSPPRSRADPSPHTTPRPARSAGRAEGGRQGRDSAAAWRRRRSARCDRRWPRKGYDRPDG